MTVETSTPNTRLRALFDRLPFHLQAVAAMMGGVPELTDDELRELCAKVAMTAEHVAHGGPLP